MLARNQPCPYGSGLRYKQCHGTIRGAVGEARPVLPTIDDLCEFETAQQAGDYARRLLAAAPNSLESALSRNLAARLMAFPQALAKDLAAGGESVDLLPIGPEAVEVVLVAFMSARVCRQAHYSHRCNLVLQTALITSLRRRLCHTRS